MEHLHGIEPLKQWRQIQRLASQSVALVPTMGALHDGHLALVEAARKQADRVVVSIYVNPLQFDQSADLQAYPRVLERDRLLLMEAGVDALFSPPDSQMYPTQPVAKLHFGHLEQVLEGEHRPGHFAGVGVVVAKLLNLVQPDTAWFGQKDYQQLLIIGQLVADLSFPVQLHSLPTVRAEDGLALSSRNERLSPAQRQLAPSLYEALQTARTQLGEGQPWKQVHEHVQEFFAVHSDCRLEYFQLCHRATLRPLGQQAPLEQGILLAALWVGEVRLIDNLPLSPLAD